MRPLLLASYSAAVAVVLSTSACGQQRAATSPAPSAAPAEVRALAFVVGEYTWSEGPWSEGSDVASSPSSGALRCAWNPAGLGVDCAEDVNVGGEAKHATLTIRWDASPRLYRLETTNEGGETVEATGQLGDGGLVFTTADGVNRTTLARHGDGLRLLAEACREGTCQAFTKLDLEVPFVTPPDDRNG